MHLKSLKLLGFKSFADRTRLEFRPGVTVVVGPNGSGKSNLVDALSWVLGTQSAKTLRTEKMEEVIFAGTATRPSLGKAEVTLVIDNTERMLDIDLDEIAITRRLYRDGSSDYEMNGVGCRLLDIQDLLSDSGVGRHQHVIIGQGEIGRVLNASEDEHRGVIEEAAGILKHKRRKERAERRLERTDEDMVRLGDLLGEIERRMRPLRRQAKAAERYQETKDQVVALRLYLAGQELATLDRELTIAVSEKAMLTERLQVDQRKLADLADRLALLTAETGSVAADLERDTLAGALLETTVERLRRIGSVAQERSRAVSGRREAVVERRGDLEQEARSIDERLETIAGEISQARGAYERSEAAFRRLEAEEQALASQNSLSPDGALAATGGELSALRLALARDRRELEALSHRLDVVGSQAEGEAQEIERINDEIRQMDADVTDLQERYAGASTQRAKLQERWAAAEGALREAVVAVASARARRDAVSSALEGRFDPEARQAVEKARGAMGTVTSLLDIPEGLEAAVSAALGEWADAVAFSDPDSVYAAIEAVRAAGGGSVSAVSAGLSGQAPLREVSLTLGVDALVDLLGPNADQGLATSFLGDVAVVEGWSAGWSLVSRHPSLRAVTPEGDLISATAIHIADPDGAGSAMLEAAEVALERAETEQARAESIHMAARRDFEKCRIAERDALETLEQAESGLSGHSEAMRRLQASVEALEEERRRLTERRTAVETALSAAEEHEKLLEDRLGALGGEEGERLTAWEEMEARRALVASRREVARSEWQEAATALRAITERTELLEERRRIIGEELDRLDHGVPEVGDPARLDSVAARARTGVGILERRLTELRERQAELRGGHALLKAQLDEMRLEHEERTLWATRARARISELEVELTELRMRRESVMESIRRDADADEEQAMGAPRPDIPEGDEAHAILESRLAELRRMGPINPLAAEEYRELEERHDFLTAQKADVESSRAELRKVISALEDEIDSRFQAAFSEVASAYERYFAVLFPGGRGRIRLVDPDDPRSGVVIEAQPHGKRLASMSLLSGGERSLAALAFLFAIVDARPSPFYVLDEVEAALDHANLRRFLRVVDELREQAQMIIITHQQQTMEAADVLYGVTMEPGGSSQVVRKEMRASVGSDRVA